MKKNNKKKMSKSPLSILWFGHVFTLQQSF